MIFRRRAVSASRVARLAPGERVYAVGDIHGRLDLLTALIADIEQDDARRHAAKTTLIFLGDLLNRGPDSAGVVRLVRDTAAAGRFHVRLIQGNHEEVFLLAAQGSSRATRALVDMGGAATVRSFGVSDDEAGKGTFADLAALLTRRVPAQDLQFLNTAEHLVEIGGYVFVHAGIKPGTALHEQQVADLHWIRTEFLDSERDHGKIVVHGHTITEKVDQRLNRIGVDTGAFATGRLSALGLEADRRWVIDVQGEAQST